MCFELVFRRPSRRRIDPLGLGKDMDPQPTAGLVEDEIMKNNGRRLDLLRGTMASPLLTVTPGAVLQVQAAVPPPPLLSSAVASRPAMDSDLDVGGVGKTEAISRMASTPICSLQFVSQQFVFD